MDIDEQPGTSGSRGGGTARLVIFMCSAGANIGRRQSLRRLQGHVTPLAARCFREPQRAQHSSHALRPPYHGRSWFRYSTDADSPLPELDRGRVRVCFVVSLEEQSQELAAEQVSCHGALFSKPLQQAIVWA
jgi:hypothetical protein